MKSEWKLKDLIVPVVVMLTFWGLAIWGYLSVHLARPLIMFGSIGTSVGLGLGLYAYVSVWQDLTAISR